MAGLGSLMVDRDDGVILPLIDFGHPIDRFVHDTISPEQPGRTMNEMLNDIHDQDFICLPWRDE